MSNAQSPMPKQVSGLNTSPVIHYLREHHSEIDLDDLVADIHHATVYHIRNLTTDTIEPVALHHLMEPNYWFSNRFMMDFYRAITNRIPDPGLGYRIGRAAHRAKPVAKAAFFAPLVGPRELIKRIAKENDKFNQTKHIEMIKSQKAFSVLRLTHHEGIIVNAFAMDWHAGVFHTYVAFTGANNIHIEWYPRDERLKVVDFEISYTNPGLIRRLTTILLLDIRVVRDAIERADDIEEDHRRTILNLEKIIQDRTDRLEAMQHRLLEQERLMTETYIAGGMAHEIRNALGAAKLRVRRMEGADAEQENLTHLQTLLRYFKESRDISEDERRTILTSFRALYESHKKTKASVDAIEQAIERGLGIANRVMDYTALSHRKTEEAIDLGQVAKDLAAIYEEDLKGRGIELTLNLKAGLIISGSANQIHSVLQNLLLNARDAIAEASPREGRITMRGYRQEPSIFFEMEDNGCGIEAIHQDRIFQPFFSTKPQTGMGLGLNECRKIVVASGGGIAFESSPEKGSVFRIWFPG